MIYTYTYFAYIYFAYHWQLNIVSNNLEINEYFLFILKLKNFVFTFVFLSVCTNYLSTPAVGQKAHQDPAYNVEIASTYS